MTDWSTMSAAETEAEALRQAMQTLATWPVGWSDKAKRMARYADAALYNAKQNRDGKPGLPLPRVK